MIEIEQFLQQMFKADGLLAQGKDVLRHLVGVVNVILGQRSNVVCGLCVGGNKAVGTEGFDPLQCIQVGPHIIENADLVFCQGLFAGEAIGQVDDAVLRLEPYHIKEVAWEGKHFPALGQHIIGEVLGLAWLCQEEFVAQVFGREPAVQVGGLQQWMSGQGTLYAGIDFPQCDRRWNVY